MIRVIFALILCSFPLEAAAQSTPEGRDLRDMPVMALYCDDDPGPINIGGGKEPSPDTLIDSGRCAPATGVAITFVLVREEWDFEHDDPEADWDVTEDSWFARCEIDADGRCTLLAPVGFDIVIGVFPHDGAIRPGYAPASFQPTTHNYTEFAGYGLALVPTGDPVGDPADHQTLALNISADGQPASALTSWDIGNGREQYLATNTGGWVSTTTAAGQQVSITVVNARVDASIEAQCAANDDPTAVANAVVRNNAIEIAVPETSSDIRCDITIAR